MLLATADRTRRGCFFTSMTLPKKEAPDPHPDVLKLCQHGPCPAAAWAAGFPAGLAFRTRVIAQRNPSSAKSVADAAVQRLLPCPVVPALPPDLLPGLPRA